MKTFFSVVLMATTLFVSSPQAHALFGHTAAEQRRREQAEEQLVQVQQRLTDEQHLVAAQQQLTTEQQRLTSRWQTTSLILGIVAVVMLILGTAIGSKTNHDHGTTHP